MANNNVKYLDLDAVLAETPEVVIKLFGNEHKLVPLSVDGFLGNLKIVEKLGLNPSTEEEIAAVKEMLLKSFPTISEGDLSKLTLPQLQRFLEFAQSANGENEVKESAEGNSVAAS
mgnify:CR=1 FL=1